MLHVLGSRLKTDNKGPDRRARCQATYSILEVQQGTVVDPPSG